MRAVLVTLACAGALVGYFEYQILITQAAIEQVAKRVAISEAVPKCIAEFENEEMEVDPVWWRREAKPSSVERGSNLYAVRFWQFGHALWKAAHLDVYVTLIALERGVQPVVCVYDVADGRVVQVYAY